ncbi:DUF1566 domain-containing protein, partial [Treponema primitia]|uniref:Lcl domain-containing protein n=1 Tax=Treponema primitia TaxID=88058 RepID=UPI0039809522
SINFLRQNGQTGMAAQLCTGYTGGEKNDWFLPSKDELDLIYKNLKAKGLGSLDGRWYWSSSENGSSVAWVQDFSDGSQYGRGKNATSSVRAVRAF